MTRVLALRGVLVVGALLGVCRPAASQDRVLVYEAQGNAQAGLIQALRIQLGTDVSVQAAGPLQGSDLPSRIEAATAATSDRAVAVWVEGPLGKAGPRQIILYLVGTRRGRALIEVLSVEGALGPEVDRSLALKVQEVLDTLGETRAKLAAALAPEATPQQAAKSRPDSGVDKAPSATEQEPAQTAALVADLGVEVAPLQGSRAGIWGLGVGLGLPLVPGELQVSVEGRMGLAPSVESKSGGAAVELQRLSPALGLHLAHGAGLRAGLGLGAELQFWSATGRSPSGRSGEARTTLLSAYGRIDLTLAVWSTLSVRAWIGARLSPRRLGFSVNNRAVSELSRLRSRGGLSLVMQAP